MLHFRSMLALYEQVKMRVEGEVVEFTERRQKAETGALYFRLPSGYFDYFPKKSMNVAVLEKSGALRRKYLVAQKDFEPGDVIYTVSSSLHFVPPVNACQNLLAGATFGHRSRQRPPGTGRVLHSLLTPYPSSYGHHTRRGSH